MATSPSREGPVRPRERHPRPASLIAVVVVTTLALAAAGCGASDSASVRPTEARTREAYFDTPLIRADAAAAVRLGITRRQLRDALGSDSKIELVDPAGRHCLVYPLLGTESRDRYGSPVADETWFCFGTDGRLAAKRRYPAPGPQ